jgi:ribonucleotide monophosphatase NagD (HAD superfamily)
VEASTGRRPDRIVGKPQPDILRAAMSRFGATPEETVMIGDRLYTDVACGNAAGVDSVLVLSGESTAEMAAESPHRPGQIEATLETMLVP